MTTQTLDLHIFFFPLMAPGHIIPMLDMARLFSSRGVASTLLTTPANVSLLAAAVDNSRSAGLPLHLLTLPFPSSYSSPENLSSLSSAQQHANFFAALELLRHPFDEILRQRRPSCVVSDMFLPWTAEVANKLRIPRIVFHAMGFFPRCLIDAVDRYASTAGIDENEVGDAVLVPGLPHRIEMKKMQLPESIQKRTPFTEFMARMLRSELESYGAVSNTFYELEPDYVEHYTRVMGHRAWCVGPVSLCERDSVEVSARGAPSSGSVSSHESCLKWLDSKAARSVVYACFGSLCCLTRTQLQEIALGLLASGHSFILVLRDVAEELLPEVLDEMSKHESKCLIIRGWAPQLLILDHVTVGAFLTHCGWNSVMESVAAGVPMITWPLFGEQFYNERLLVDVLRVGVSVGLEVWSNREEEKVLVKRGEIVKAVACVMDGGEEADSIRERIGVLKKKAKMAMANGGSSDSSIKCLIDELVGIQ